VGEFPEYRRELPDVESVIGFRNVIAHGYDAIDDRRVWDTIETALPTHLSKVRVLMAKEADLP